jgi:hypothetical protein
MRDLFRTVHTFLLVPLVICGCDLGDSQESETQLDSSVHGKQVAYALNESFSLELDLNADAGCLWYHSISDTTVVHLDSTKYRPKSGDWGMVGGMTVATFHFRATRIGRCTIDLAERQGWLPNDPPWNSVRFSVVVFR